MFVVWFCPRSFTSSSQHLIMSPVWSLCSGLIFLPFMVKRLFLISFTILKKGRSICFLRKPFGLIPAFSLVIFISNVIVL